MITQPVSEAAGVGRDDGFLYCVNQRARVLAGETDVKVFVQPEVKHHVKPVIITEIVAVLLDVNVNFAQQNGLRVMPLDKSAQMFQDPQPPFLLAASGLLCEMRSGIQTKAGNPQLQPKDNDIFDLFNNGRRGQVEIGFVTIKHMAKILPGFFIPRPDALLDAGKHRRRIVIIAIRP